MATKEKKNKKTNNEETNTKNVKKEKKKSGIGAWILLIIVLLAGAYMYKEMEKEEVVDPDFSKVDKICELATLRCFYHDVAEYEKQPDGLFKFGLFQYGYKKFWLEYDGIVEVGIDADKVQVGKPDEKGVVNVYVPEARILSVDADEESMSDKPISDTGLFTTIKTEEKIKAYAKAQENMEKKAKNDKSILKEAHNNAKDLIEQYIINIGKQIGQDFTVNWLEEPVSSEE